MRKNYIIKQPVQQILMLMVVVLVLNSCVQNKTGTQNEQDLSKTKTDLPVIKAKYGTRTFTEEVQGIVNYDTRNQSSISSKVSGRIDRLWIKYNYQPVKKGQLIMEIYSPDLAAAQQELLFIKRNEDDPEMLARAKQRLTLLGMTASGINQLLKTGKVNYKVPVYSNANGYILEKAGTENMERIREGQYVSAGQSLFTIYNADRLVAEFSLRPAQSAHVKKGTRLTFYQASDKSDKTAFQTANIGMIQPTFRNGENFTLARVYLTKLDFKVGELLIAKIPVLLPKSWWLPKSSVVSLGNKTVLFKKEGDTFIPKVIQTGVTITGMVQVKTDIGNWNISKNAAYLIDSESFIKTH